MNQRCQHKARYTFLNRRKSEISHELIGTRKTCFLNGTQLAKELKSTIMESHLSTINGISLNLEPSVYQIMSSFGQRGSLGNGKRLFTYYTFNSLIFKIYKEFQKDVKKI